MALKKPAAFEQEPQTDAANDAAAAAGAVDSSKAADNAAASAPTDAAVTPVKVKEAAIPAANDTTAASGTAVVVAASGALITADEAAAKAKEFQKEVERMRGASDFAYGNYRVFKGNNGNVVESGGEEENLGRWAQVRMISWNDHFEISPGEQAASTREFVGYSKDGKTVDSVIGEDNRSWVGKAVGEYLEYLRTEEGFAQAKSRRFIDIGAALLGCDSGDGPVGSVIQITLSESSIPSFSRYQQELNDNARCVQMGIPGFKLPADPFTFFVIRELASKGSNKWTKLNIKGSLPVKI